MVLAAKTHPRVLKLIRPSDHVGKRHHDFDFDQVTGRDTRREKSGQIAMLFLPFFLDRSPTAKLLKAFNLPNQGRDQLEQLQCIMKTDMYKVPYGYLDQARRRSAIMLPIAGDEEEKTNSSFDLHECAQVHSKDPYREPPIENSKVFLFMARATQPTEWSLHKLVTIHDKT